MNKDQTRLMSLMSFVALILTAAIQATVFIIGLFDGTIELGWLSFIANIMLTVVVVWVAWQYAKGLSQTWKVIFLIVAIMAILSSVGVSFMPAK